MKMKIRAIACVALIAGLTAQAHAAGKPAGDYSLTVTVTGAKEGTGIVRAALFSDSEAFPDGKSAASAEAPLKGKNSVRLTFRHLAPGTYAISLYHDANGNNSFDQAVFGIPKESYGFSNISKEVTAKPKFDEAKFDIQKNTTLTIPLLGP